VRILLRADSGFAREELMAWCEANNVHFLFGLAKNDRLIAAINSELDKAAAKSHRTGKPARYFKDFMWITRKSWSQSRRVLAKAECTQGEANPRFVVTSLRRAECKARYLYEKIYCARGDTENRSRSVNSISISIVPRPLLCGPISCACGSPRWLTSCSAPCAELDCPTQGLPKQAAAPFA
jgi:hypothetical protein